MSRYLVLVFLYTITLFTFVYSQTYEKHAVPVSIGYIQAIDAAVYSMTQDKSFQDSFKSLMFFNVPQCTNSVSFPKIDPFIGRKALVMCIEQGAIYPFGDVKELVAKTIVKKINDNYRTNYETQIRIMETAKLGFFTTMKNAVDNGECDVISTNVQFTEERRKIIHYQCAWGSTSKGFLRTEKDPSLSLTTFSSLNRTGISVSAYKGTTYEADVLSLSAVRYVPMNFSDEQYGLIVKKEVHAALDNSVTLLTWLNDNRKECQNCSVYFIGEPYPFATFTTNIVSGFSLLSVQFTYIVLFVIALTFKF